MDKEMDKEFENYQTAQESRTMPVQPKIAAMHVGTAHCIFEIVVKFS
jgi:hypothetical protein